MNPLPTRNSQLALRRADYRSVPEMLDYAARGETGVTFYNVRGEILRPWPGATSASGPRSPPAG